MNKIIILSLIALVMSVKGFSQPLKYDLRNTETKIADLLMELPAQNSADLRKMMADLAAWGEPAISGLAANLVSPGKGNDTASRYAISGLVKYVARGSDKELKKSCSLAVGNALANVKDDEVKDFLLQELQYVAGDEAVPLVSALLMNERLCDPAARVLVRINSELSAKSLAEALPEAEIQQQIILAEAIGRLKYAPAAEYLKELASSANPDLKKSVLRSLAETGDLTSANLLASEAKKAGFSFEPSDAAGSYLLFLKRTAENGNPAFAEKACKKIIRNNGIPGYTRSAILEILAASAGEQAIPVLFKTLRSPDKDLRIAAQSLLGNLSSREAFSELRTLAGKTKNPELQSELVSLLARTDDKIAYPLMLDLLKSENKQVQSAAISAVAKTGQSNAVAPLTDLMKTGDKEIINTVQTALLTIPGENVADAAASAIPLVSGAARSALIGIIAHRCAVRYGDLIFAETGNTDPQVRLAATKALPAVVKIENLEKIAKLLNQATAEEEISALQDALFSATQTFVNKGEQTLSILALMEKAGDRKQRYYQIYPKIGGEEALALVEKEFENGNPQQKETALKALSAWSDFTALNALYRISKTNLSGNLHQTALSSYIAGISKSQNTTDQKVLMFRNAMELATTIEQKKQILNGISRNRTLQSLVFASSYLDDPELQQTAIQAVGSIVRSNTALFGPFVEDIVQKAIILNKDDEAEYQKQALMKHMAALPKEGGFVPMFNGKDLSGWKGLVGNPLTRAAMSKEELSEAQIKADKEAYENWVVENGVLLFTGKGTNLCSVKDYGDFELVVDWKLYPGKEPDAGIYLRGTPQVQIWDTSRVNVGAQVGSGGLYNNRQNAGKPLLVADNQVGEWNTFNIKMTDDKVTVYLNGQLVVDNVILENFWDRSRPIFRTGPIELQAHGSKVAYRDIYIREIPGTKPYKVSKQEEEEGFNPLFNGINMDGWTGNTIDYFAQEGLIVCKPSGHGSGNLYTTKEYSDFILRFEFQLTPGANNGLGIRTPLTGDAAYQGMELQILDNEADIYKKLMPYQYHGSVYGVIPAKRGYLKLAGEWNYQEVMADGNRIRVTLNGEVIMDGDIAVASKNGTETPDKKNHPGLLNKSGHIGFLGHGSPLKFRNIRLKELSK